MFSSEFPFDFMFIFLQKQKEKKKNQFSLPNLSFTLCPKPVIEARKSAKRYVKLKIILFIEKFPFLSFQKTVPVN